MSTKVFNGPLNAYQVLGDNVTVSGQVYQKQYVQLDIGTTGASSPVTASNPLPVYSSGASSLTASSPTLATVGVTSALALAASATRRGLILTNTSTNTISIAFGASAAVLRSGITILPGGTFNMDEFSFNTGIVNAIASGASSNLAIQEFTT